MSKFCSFWVFFTPFPFAKEFFIALHWHIFDKSCYPSLLSFCLSLSFPPFSFFPSLFLSSSSLFYTLPLSPFSSPFRSLFPKHVLSSLSSSNWLSFYPYARRNVFRELERKRNHSILIIYPLPQRERFGFLQFAFNLAHFSSGILELESTPNDNAMSISQFFLYFTVLFHITRSNAQYDIQKHPKNAQGNMEIHMQIECTWHVSVLLQRKKYSFSINILHFIRLLLLLLLLFRSKEV